MKLTYARVLEHENKASTLLLSRDCHTHVWDIIYNRISCIQFVYKLTRKSSVNTYSFQVKANGILALYTNGKRGEMREWEIWWRTES